MIQDAKKQIEMLEMMQNVTYAVQYAGSSGNPRFEIFAEKNYTLIEEIFTRLFCGPEDVDNEWSL